MKAFFITTLMLGLVMFLAVPKQTYAQSGTLTLYASSSSTLDQEIGGDTTSSGAQKHSVYKLVSLDTCYIFDATITIKSGVSIVGVPDPSTGKLPTIQPDVLSGGTIPGTFFAFTGVGTRITVKNIYFLGLAINNTAGYGVALSILADSISLTADNLVFDDFTGDAFSYASNWDNLYITNCKMRNSFNPGAGDWYEGEFIRNQNGTGAFKTDTIIVRYSTLSAVAAYVCAATGGIINYFEVSHCNIINTFKNPFFVDRVVNAKFDNNLFYNAYAGGENRTEFAGWDSFTPNTGPSIITIGLLDSTTASILLGHAASGPGDPAAELLRKVEVKNNDYFWSSALTNFYKTWNDTAHVDTIYTPTFMNDTTKYMFDHPTQWPGFVASGNVNIDPGFGPSIDATLNGGTGYGAGFFAYFTAVRNGTYDGSQIYGTKITDIPQPEPYDWTPAWPLPEASDMQYSNASLKTGGTDGKAIGDGGWFTNGYTGVAQTPNTLPGKFELSNNYPNPFNPSTIIKFSLAKAGNVSLKVYNVMGQLVKTVIANDYRSNGNYEISVNMNNFASGVYFYSLRQGNNIVTKKMMLLK